MKRILRLMAGVLGCGLGCQVAVAIDAELYQKYQMYQSRQQATQASYLEQARAALQAGNLEAAQKQLDIAKNLGYAPESVSALESQIVAERGRRNEQQRVQASASGNNSYGCEYASEVQSVLSSARNSCVAYSSMDALNKQGSASSLAIRAQNLMQRMPNDCGSEARALRTVVSLCNDVQNQASSAHQALDGLYRIGSGN